MLIAALFFLASLVTQYINNKKYSPARVQIQLQQAINAKEKDFEYVCESSYLDGLLRSSKTTIALDSLVNKPYGIFVYDGNTAKQLQLKAWSNNKYHLAYKDVQGNDSSYCVAYENGLFELIRKHKVLGNDTLMVAAVIPVKWDYFIKNKYLNNDFNDFATLQKYYEVSNKSTGLPIKNSKGNALLYLSKTKDNSFFEYNTITLVLRIIAIVFLVLFVNSVAVQINLKSGYNKATLFLLGSFVLLRLVRYVFPNLVFVANKLSLFDPSVYASNFLHPSLADLLVNMILLFWVLVFYKKYYVQSGKAFTAKGSVILTIFNLWWLTVTSFLFANLLKSLVIDSKISFDVSNFFSLNLYSWVAFIVIGLLFINYFLLSVVLLQKIKQIKTSLPVQLIIIAALAMLLVLFKLATQSQVENVGIILWLIAYTIVIQSIKEVNIDSVIYRNTPSFFWTIVLTSSAAAFIVSLSKKLEIEQRKKIAENIYLQSDATTESLVSIATGGFNEGFFRQNINRLKDAATSESIKDSLVTENFSGYLSRFETKIFLFDNRNQAINNKDTTKQNGLEGLIQNSGKEIGPGGLFSVNISPTSHDFIFKKTVTDEKNNLLCNLYILLASKKHRAKGVAPELFHQGQDADRQSSYPFAVYKNGKLIEQNGNYDFLLNQTQKDNVYTLQQTDKTSVLIYQPTKINTIIIVKQTRYWLDFITLFAYLFFSFLVVESMLFVIGALLKFKSFSFLNQLFQLNYRSQLRATVLFVSALSFLLIGIVTILFFVSRFKQISEERLVKSIDYAALQMAEFAGKKMDSVKSVEAEVLRIAEQQNIDINLFDTAGNVIATTQPYIFNKHLVDEQMHPVAFNKIFSAKATLYKQEEQIGKLSYIGLYKPVINEEGRFIACINIPYLNAEAELNQEISGFIATLINLNAFIFLIAGVIAFFITNRITSSLSLIKDKMRAINWQERTEEIVWNKEDEIGALVNEYNAMVRKLDETAKAFAQSQKEQAWREMAKQVAHEIKNPLTPMKLSIQYLQNSIDNNAPNVKGLSKKVAATLIEQIDQLSNIANSFSQFANIGNNNAERLDINEVLKSIAALYTTSQNIEIEQNITTNPNYVQADKQQMMRLFTNLIKNAVEASSNDHAVKIIIEQEVKEASVVIKVIDYGSGIPSEMQPKIFSVNFTTKSSGTGLGLAICKGIVENANGSIEFATSSQGTTFFVELPLIN